MSDYPEPPYEMHVISNTHWDREWHYPFETTRMLLVDVIDELLRILDTNPEYACYHLDSQTVMLEDYLEIRPENRKRLEDYIKQGRIMAGPFYTGPDMNTLTGESVVRNLLVGHRIARQFGGVMKIGYTPFGFGQVSQLPQIYAGFGIDTIFFYRGVGRHRAKAEFIWEAPDGTRALASQFGKKVRYNFYFHVYRKVVDDRELAQTGITWQLEGRLAHPCEEGSQYEPAFALDYKKFFIKKHIKPGIYGLLEEDKKEFTTPIFILMQGCDSTAPNDDEPQIVKICDEALEEGSVVHSTLPAYVERLKDKIDLDKLTVLKGEMRFPPKDGGSEAMRDTISCRIYLKQENARATSLVEKWAEPASVAGWLFGMEYPAKYLDIAWKYLLINHAHDSIAGSCVDRVHDDMMYRFAQVRIIANELTRRGLARLIVNIDSSGLDDNETQLTIFNSLPHKRSEILTVNIDFPRADTVKNFDIRDEEGRKVDFQVREAGDANDVVQLRADWPQNFPAKRYTIFVDAKNVPALGYRSFTVTPKPVNPVRSHPYMLATSSLEAGGNTMENESLKVTLNTNGTITILDKETGKTFENGHYFEDCGEAGAAYFHIKPLNDTVYTSFGSAATVVLEDYGPLKTTFRVELAMEVPAHSNANERSAERGTIAITSWISLERGSKVVKFRTRVNNTVREHRLRVCFPTYLDSQTSCADSAFDVVTRPIHIDEDRSDWMEFQYPTHPMLTFCDTSDAETGLAFLGKGLPEYEVTDDAARTIKVTLLRTLKDVWGEGFPPPEHEGLQQLGVNEYEYALYPHAGTWEEAGAAVKAGDFNAGLRAFQSGRHSQLKGKLPVTASLVSIEPANLLLSGIKKAEERDTVIVRFFNPTEADVEGTVTTLFDIAEAHRVDLEENRLEKLELTDTHRISIQAGKKKIISIELKLKNIV